MNLKFSKAFVFCFREKSVQQHTGSDDEIKVMELLRKEKDNFKGK